MTKYIAIFVLTIPLFSHSIVEDFLTDTYKDIKATSADWNIMRGVLTLPKHIEVVDQQSTKYTSASAIGRERVMAQSFTTGPTFVQLGRIDVYLTYGLGRPVDIILRVVRADSQGLPTNQVIAEKIIPAFDTPAWPNYAWKTVIFDPPINVSPNSRYVIILSAPASETRNVYYWAYGFDSTGGYPGGMRINSFDGGITWQPADWEDFMFQTYSPKLYTIEPGFVRESIGQSLGYDTGYLSVKYETVKLLYSRPANTDFKILFSDSEDNINFSDWVENITTLSRRYIRFRIILRTADPYASPEIDRIEIVYTPQLGPVIERIYPSSGAITGNTKVEIFGQNFSKGAGVKFGDIPVDYSKWVSTSSIIVLSPPGRSFGKTSITVSNPDGQSSTLDNAFQYLPIFRENFLSMKYRDPLNTTADWNVEKGCLKLPKSDLGDLDSEHLNYTSLSAIGQKRYMAQTFTTSANFSELDRIEVYLTYAIGTRADITVKLTEVDPWGLPTNSIIAETKVSGANIPAWPNFAWVSIRFERSIILKPNQKYALILCVPYSDVRNLYYWGYGMDTTYGGYPGGMRVNSFDGGITWVPAPWEDFIFRVYRKAGYYTKFAVAESLPYDLRFGVISFFVPKIKTEVLNNTTVQIYFSQSDDGVTFSDWQKEVTGFSKRYIKWRAELTTYDTFITPIIYGLEMDFLLKHISYDRTVIFETQYPDITIKVATGPVISGFALIQTPDFVSEIYEIGPKGTTFDPPAVISFYYQDINQDGYVDNRNYRETDLKIYTYDELTNTWIPIPEQMVNTVDNYVEGKIAHLSLFGLGYFAPQPEPVLSSGDTTADVHVELAEGKIADVCVEPVGNIIADVRIEPEVLNLESEGKFVTVYIELDKKDLKKINRRTISIIKVNLKDIEPIYAETKPTGIDDHDSDGIPELMVKICRDKLKEVLSVGENELVLVGEFSDGVKFIGKCKIKAIKPKKEKLHITESSTQTDEKSKMKKDEVQGGEIKKLTDEKLYTGESPPMANEKTKTEEGRVKEEETKKLAEEKVHTTKPSIQTEEKTDKLPRDDKKIHNVKVKQIKELNDEKVAGLKEQGLKFLNSGIKFETEDINQTHEIKIPISDITINLEDISVYFWNDNTKQWQRIKHYIDEKSKEIKILASSPGYYILASTVDLSFSLKQAYVYPNPAKTGENPKIYIECGLADKVELTILDILGNIIYAKNINNDIVESFNRYAYQHEWDIKDVPSGVYIYRVCAEKIGYEPINIIGKIAIIK